MSPSLSVITTVVVGLMVGVEFSVAFVINPITLALPAPASMAARSHGARMMGRAMPFWYFGSLILTGVLAVTTWGTTASVAALAAAALLAVSVIMSIALLVPINNRSASWTDETYPEDWREQTQRWDNLHYIRVAIIVGAFALVAVAATSL
ncbi:protein of unknown function [Rhodococcus rhodochrous J3]|uniref:DUF1772 domain-containing protein n=2 Tax=Rhodococcus rhodochrous TaxID=1829 RepID=A0A385LGI2_RHORH|nr:MULTISPECIES: DUF1772 domain-containing protein [Rhodococcus]MCR8695442.1 DUF1772 domain-containing protein [Rhodococcus pyridinivorans]AYA27086.1 DUF1772 domain-containing protein [Rhodococcus rhodochrous]MBF4477987.1 DUF1772 domain-containing protein [Rhodococcus rhodochrous]MCB8909212.1 DUF1772 domain-containing protein [Rhodococcus rhodochrous]MDC3726264.1 DUF1772 domain-containing protein [Rhodococcus sp. Rp3]